MVMTTIVTSMMYIIRIAAMPVVNITKVDDGTVITAGMPVKEAVTSAINMRVGNARKVKAVEGGIVGTEDIGLNHAPVR